VKIKLIAVAVAGILLSGCNDENGEVIGLSVQAFDPAVQYMTALAECDDAPSETSITGYDGNAKFLTLAPLSAPETCKFTFTGEIGSGAVDVSNGKSMEGVTYTIPKGMAQAGSPVTASPMTTLIAKDLIASGNPYSEEAARLVLVSLGLDSLISDDLSVTELLSNTEAVLEELTTTNSANASLLAATTSVLSDVLAEDPTATATELAISASAIADEVLVSEPNYPTNSDGKVVTNTVTPADITSVVDQVKADPVAAPTVRPQVPTEGTPVKETDPKPTPPTGGTGGGNGKVPS